MGCVLGISDRSPYAAGSLFVTVLHKYSGIVWLLNIHRYRITVHRRLHDKIQSSSSGTAEYIVGFVVSRIAGSWDPTNCRTQRAPAVMWCATNWSLYAVYRGLNYGLWEEFTWAMAYINYNRTNTFCTAISSGSAWRGFRVSSLSSSCSFIKVMTNRIVTVDGLNPQPLYTSIGGHKPPGHNPLGQNPLSVPDEIPGHNPL